MLEHKAPDPNREGVCNSTVAAFITPLGDQIAELWLLEPDPVRLHGERLTRRAELGVEAWQAPYCVGTDAPSFRSKTLEAWHSLDVSKSSCLLCHELPFLSQRGFVGNCPEAKGAFACIPCQAVENPEGACPSQQSNEA